MASKRGKFLEPERPLEANSPTFGSFVGGEGKISFVFFFPCVFSFFPCVFSIFPCVFSFFPWVFSIFHVFSPFSTGFIPSFGMILAHVFLPYFLLHLERWGVSQMLNGSAGSPGRRAFQFTPKSQRHIGDGWWEIVYGGFITNWDK